jgi:hypothetical protein
MSLLKSNSVQIGQSATATQNFTLSVPSSPDGTIKLARGNSGATTQDILSVNSSGAVTINNLNNQSFRNRIINGDMRIDQRNAGASVTPATGAYTLDRWSYYSTQASKFTVQRNAGSVTPPAGYTNYMGITSTSAFSIAASDYFIMTQAIEGFNVSDLSFGTANAKSITISFWVYSSLTGTFGGVIENSNQTRAYPFSYTISSANTWEQKSVTIAGDTTGTWVTDNGLGLWLMFSLGAGSTYAGTAGAWVGSQKLGVTGAVSVVGTNGATFYITGVQLEQGSTATEFERRPIGTELALCQRYLQTWGGTALYERVAFGYAVSTTQVEVFLPRFSVPMRTAPSLNANSPSNFRVSDATGSTTLTSIFISQSTPNSCGIIAQVASGLTTFRAMSLDTNNTLSALLSLGAEL